jgi:DME family drug/metabolite transporter
MAPFASQKLSMVSLWWTTFKDSTAIGYLAVLIASASWATSGIFVKYILDSGQISPLALAFWRDLFTFLVLLAGVGTLRPKYLRIHLKDTGWLFALGASIGIFHVFWNLGINLNGAAVTTVQQAAMPAIVAVIAWFLWREPLSWRKILAIVLTFSGTVLVSGPDELGQAQMTLGAVVVGFGLPISYASWSLFGKKIRNHYNALTVLTYAFGVGALVLFPFLFFTRQPWPMLATTGVWFTALIGISTIASFTSYTFALGRLPASVASILAMSEIAFVVLFAYVLLGEWLSVVQISGAVMVTAGVLLLLRRQRRAGA